MIQAVKKFFYPLGDKSEADLQEEFKSLYLENKDFVRTIIYWNVRSGDIDDLVQQTFLKAWNSFNKFRHQSHFRTWIYKIAINTCYDELRKKSHAQTENGKVEEIADFKNSETSIELKDLISKGLARIKPKQREVFILFYKLEFSLLEIANILSISEGTVKSRLFYAKESFVMFLKENGVSHE